MSGDWELRDEVIQDQLSPPSADDREQARFTQSVLAANQKQIRRKNALVVMISVTCAFVIWAYSKPVIEPLDPALNQVAKNTVMTDSSANETDPLELFWAEYGSVLDGYRDPNLEEDDLEEYESETYGDIAWMPSHYQAFSDLLGLTEEEESL